MARFHAVLPLALFVFGCGDDTGTGTDSGTPDTGVPSDGSPPDSGGGTTMRTAALRFVDQNESPIDGVMVAIDTDMGRVEGVSDTAGEVSIDYSYMADSTDIIAALEGYRIWAFVDATYAAPDSDDGYRELVLDDLDPEPGVTVTVDLDASGVPAGGRYCAAIGSFITSCLDEGDTWGGMFPLARIADNIQDHVYGFAFDATDTLEDFVRADWIVDPDGDRVATLAFDGVLDETPVDLDFTFNLPPDAESPYRTEPLDVAIDQTLQSWLMGTEPGTHLARSVISNVSIEADTVSLRVHSFPVAGDQLVWSASPYANNAQRAQTFVWYSGMAPSTIDFLDLARVRSGSLWTDEFEWTAPATDVERYLAQLLNAGGRVIAQLTTTSAYGQMPALPSGYDTSVSFPFPGASGFVQVIALRGDQVPDETATDPYRADGEASRSLRYPITF